MFGEDFSGYKDPSEVDEAIPEPTAPQGQTDVAAPAKPASTDPSKSAKGKLAAKSTGLQYQFQIMELIGIPRNEIKKFTDPLQWMKYFPPIAKEDCTSLGARIDWRRSFVTTDINPYYDSFVRWQMNQLYAAGRIKFGERYTIYSPKDDQPCMDHDRSSGEGVGPQEYTAIKMEVLDWSESIPKDVQDKLKGKKVSLVCGTLRPETMYGQTNCFIGTGLTYGIFQASDSEAFVTSDRAARNMAYQGIFEGRGEVKKLAEISGADLIGTKVSPPFGVHKEIYVVPMDGVLATKGTAIVSCVPSDSPDDYATLADLRKKPEYYKIKPEWVANEIVNVISTPEYGDCTAEALVKKFKINSQKDKNLLAEAKDVAYKAGFNTGTMLVGDFKGEPVSEAKPKVRQQMIDAKLAFAYAEPENQVISRSADECVVALCDQWYLDYGVDDWKAKAQLSLDRMNTYFSETRNAFQGVLNWLNQWACARSYGLGSKLPWDPQFLVESLSDSTIYMSFYTVAQMLQGGNIFGHETGPLGISAEDMTDDVWSYVMQGKELPADCKIDREKAAKLRYNFEYFYPMDIRSSGKDLIPNHLTFCMYVHTAIFPEDKWPLSMRANGHLMLNGKKMSKSTGNFLTLSEAIKKFGADATRLTLADSGDEIGDANFEELLANAAILRIHTAMEWASEMKQARDSGALRTGELNAHDKSFKLEMQALTLQAKKAYTATFYKEALRAGFYEMETSRNWYREVSAPENGGAGMHGDLIFEWLRTSALLVQPIIPHFSEFLWRDILQERGSVQQALWPEVQGEVKDDILKQLEYMRGVIGSMRSGEAQLAKKKSKGKTVPYDPSKSRSARIVVATKYPEWQSKVVEALKAEYEASEKEGRAIDDKNLREALSAAGLLKDKKAMPFMQTMKVCLGNQSRVCIISVDPLTECSSVYYSDLCNKLDQPFSNELCPSLSSMLSRCCSLTSRPT